MKMDGSRDEGVSDVSLLQHGMPSSFTSMRTGSKSGRGWGGWGEGSVTRWPDGLFNVWPFTTIKIHQIMLKILQNTK